MQQIGQRLISTHAESLRHELPRGGDMDRHTIKWRLMASAAMPVALAIPALLLSMGDSSGAAGGARRAAAGQQHDRELQCEGRGGHRHRAQTRGVGSAGADRDHRSRGAVEDRPNSEHLRHRSLYAERADRLGPRASRRGGHHDPRYQRGGHDRQFIRSASRCIHRRRLSGHTPWAADRELRSAADRGPAGPAGHPCSAETPSAAP